MMLHSPKIKFEFGSCATGEPNQMTMIISVGGTFWKRSLHIQENENATCSGVTDNAFCIHLSDSDAIQSIEELAFAQSRQENWPNPATVPTAQRPITYEPAANRIYGMQNIRQIVPNFSHKTRE
jgi:hypothetical protein